MRCECFAAWNGIGHRAIVAFPNFGHGPCEWRTCGADEDRLISVRMVRLAEHPFPDGGGFRGTGAEPRSGRGAVDFSVGGSRGTAVSEFDGGSGGIPGVRTRK